MNTIALAGHTLLADQAAKFGSALTIYPTKPLMPFGNGCKRSPRCFVSRGSSGGTSRERAGMAGRYTGSYLGHPTAGAP